jgi:hypothetical protein
MAVRPPEHHCVVPDRLDTSERLIGKAEITRNRGMTLTARARTPAAQVIEGELRGVAVRPIDGQDAACAVVAEFEWFRDCVCH